MENKYLGFFLLDEGGDGGQLVLRGFVGGFYPQNLREIWSRLGGGVTLLKSLKPKGPPTLLRLQRPIEPDSGLAAPEEGFDVVLA